MTKTTVERPRRISRWAVPVAAVLAGAGYLVAGILGDTTGFGVFGFVLMVVLGGAFLLGAKRSETFAGLRDRTDERINSIDRDASLFAGMVVLLAVMVMVMVEIGRGGNATPYAALGAIGGVSYLLAMLYLSLRR